MNTQKEIKKQLNKFSQNKQKELLNSFKMYRHLHKILDACENIDNFNLDTTMTDCLSLSVGENNTPAIVLHIENNFNDEPEIKVALHGSMMIGSGVIGTTEGKIYIKQFIKEAKAAAANK